MDDAPPSLSKTRSQQVAGPRQAECYEAHAGRMHQEDWDCVLTVLVAPNSYRGQRDCYNTTIDLETVEKMLDSPDPARRDYRRKIIARSLEKKATTSVKTPDFAMLRLHFDYLKWFEARCGNEGLRYEFLPSAR